MNTPDSKIRKAQSGEKQQAEKTAKCEASRRCEQGQHDDHHQKDQPQNREGQAEGGHVVQRRQDHHREHHDAERYRVAQPPHARGVLHLDHVALGRVGARNERPHGEVDRDAEPVDDGQHHEDHAHNVRVHIEALGDTTGDTAKDLLRRAAVQSRLASLGLGRLVVGGDVGRF